MSTSRPRRPGQPASPRRAPRTRAPLDLTEIWSRQLERSGMWLGVIGVGIAAVFVLFGPVQIWFEQQGRIAQLRAEVTQSEAAVSAMKANLKRWADRSYVEAQARQRLLFVYPGDVSYLIVNDITVTEATTGGATEDVVTTDINWVDALVSSYIASAVPQVAQ